MVYQSFKEDKEHHQLYELEELLELQAKSGDIEDFYLRWNSMLDGMVTQPKGTMKHALFVKQCRKLPQMDDIMKRYKRLSVSHRHRSYAYLHHQMGRIIKQRAKDKASKQKHDARSQNHGYNAYSAADGGGKKGGKGSKGKKGKGKGKKGKDGKSKGKNPDGKLDLPCFAHFKDGHCPDKSTCIYSHDDKFKSQFPPSESSAFAGTWNNNPSQWKPWRSDNDKGKGKKGKNGKSKGKGKGKGKKGKGKKGKGKGKGKKGKSQWQANYSYAAEYDSGYETDVKCKPCKHFVAGNCWSKDPNNCPQGSHGKGIMTEEMKELQRTRDKASNALAATQSDPGTKSQWQKKKEKKKKKDSAGYAAAAEWWHAESG
jgi:hypothetical protein